MEFLAMGSARPAGRLYVDAHRYPARWLCGGRQVLLFAHLCGECGCQCGLKSGSGRSDPPAVNLELIRALVAFECSA